MTGDLGALPPLPRDDDGPVFDEPWEAHAFAVAVELHEWGLFTWQEWADALAAEIRRARHAGDPDQGTTYYTHWLRALERLATAKGAVTPAELDHRTERWREAYHATPHGQPAELRAAKQP